MNVRKEEVILWADLSNEEQNALLNKWYSTGQLKPSVKTIEEIVREWR